MRAGIRAVLASALGLIGAISPFAGGIAPQQPARPGQGYSLKVEVDNVVLSVSVRERRTNQAVAGLGKDDFLVYEDGLLQKLDEVSRGETPLNTLLLIDNSGSTAARLQLIQEAAVEFTGKLRRGDRVAVAVFNSLTELIRDFTEDADLAADAIRRISPIGGTALYDALLTSVNLYMRGIEGRTAIVVFTDGVDNQLEGANTEGSKTPFEVLFRRIQEVEPVIYTIFLDAGSPVAYRPRRPAPDRQGGIGWPRFPPAQRSPDRPPAGNIREIARGQLLMIADQTGGRMYSPASAEALSNIYSEIADDLKLHYRIAYTPSSHGRDGKWHAIRVQVRGRQDVAVRTRRGYYARPATD